MFAVRHSPCPPAPVGEYATSGGADRMRTVHWNGSTWSQFSTPSLAGGPRLEGVSAGANRPTWAVGYHAVYLASQWGTVILRRINGKWVHVVSPNPNPYSNELYAVQSVSSSLAWAVGFSQDDDLTYHPLVERWNPAGAATAAAELQHDDPE